MAYLCWEHSIPLTQVTCSNLYRDVAVRVVLQQGSETRSTYAFWDGGNALKFRIVLPNPGVWTWSSSCVSGCTCASGLNLTGQQVDVQFQPMEVSSIIYPRIDDVPPNANRHLAGTFNEFFWLGDTVWMGPLRSTRSAWSSYLTDRVNRGFTVIQVALPVDWEAPGSQPMDALDPGVPGDIRRVPFEQVCSNTLDPIPNSCSRWIPAFWQEFERRIQEAHDRGLVVVVVGLMEGVIQEKAGNFCPPRLADSQIYARNVAARLAGNAVILSPGFDRTSASKQCPCYDPSQSGSQCTAGKPGPISTRINTIGNTLLGAVPHVLLTNHTGGSMPPNEMLSYQDQGWLDFQLFQSGQAGYTASATAQLQEVLCRARDLPLCVWNRTCPLGTAQGNGRICPATTAPSPMPAQTKPGVNGEALYDGVSHDKLGPTNYTRYTVRRTAYLSMFSGAAGYTYGAVGLWNWSNPTAGMGRPSNLDMQSLAFLFRNVSWDALVPHPEKITNNGTTEDTRMVLAHDAAATQLLAYLPNNPEIQIDYTSLGTLAKNGRWFDPRSGLFLDARYAQGNRIGISQVYKFCRPCGAPSCPLPPGTPARPACPASANPGDPGADYVLVIPNDFPLVP